jgi:hypothetical protein
LHPSDQPIRVSLDVEDREVADGFRIGQYCLYFNEALPRLRLRDPIPCIERFGRIGMPPTELQQGLAADNVRNTPPGARFSF